MPEEPPAKKRVVVIHTGGTIFMHRTEKGRDIGELIIPRDKNGDVSNHIDFQVIDLFGGGGVDSSKLTLKHSKKLAEKIVELQNDPSVDGIVVTHGTDTMPETALELSYTLKNLQKPVVLTGAQIPSEEKHSDGPRNFFRSIYLAAHASNLRRVVICFGYKRGPSLGYTPPNMVIDARNAEKSHISRQDAFLHPDSKFLGTVSITKGINVRANTPKPSGETTLHFKFSKWADRRVVQRHSARLPLLATGLVVDVYGAGNAPDKLIARLKRRARFYPVVAASQAKGKVDMTAYAAGRPALEAGVLPSGGLTPLSASKRLAYLVASRRDLRKAARKTGLPYRKLLPTLYLSGAEFDSADIKKAHSDILGIPIINEDLLVQFPFHKAVQRAAKALRKISTTNQPPFITR